ncbi:MAG: PilZ domain-containing protein [Nitrospira sp.]|nr:PilZ domain-containing protein [Nitrospira sp.]
MRQAQVAYGKGVQAGAKRHNQRQTPRAPVEFGLMYSAQNRYGDILMGDGRVTDLSPHGLGICGNTPVVPGMELTIFLYLPDGRDPLFVMESKVAWTEGQQFGVEIEQMNLRERNRLIHFLDGNLPLINQRAESIPHSCR